MLRWLWRITAPVVAIALLGMASAARADTIQTNLDTVVDNGDGTFTYNYQLTLTSGNGLANQAELPALFESGLIILDFVGLVGGPALSVSGSDITLTSDWSTGVVATGGGSLSNTTHVAGVTTILGTAPPVLAAGFDSAGHSNVVLEYTGALLAVDLVNARDLIHLSLTSIYGVHAMDTISLSRDTGPIDASRPVETYAIDAPVVPLPAAAWAGMALMGVIGGHKLRLSRKAQA
jgi:hypothetical protein